jgi:hypothetical protein
MHDFAGSLPYRPTTPSDLSRVLGSRQPNRINRASGDRSGEGRGNGSVGSRSVRLNRRWVWFGRACIARKLR